MIASRRIGLLTMISTVGILLIGCNGLRVRTGELVSSTPGDPGIIALVPFFEGRPDIPGRRLARCPRCEGYITVGEIAPEGPRVITSLFRRKLSRDAYTLASPEMVEKIVSTSRRPEEMPEVFAQSVALDVKADTVLMGWIFQYRERIGGDWAVQRPASVAFVALLFEGRDGRLVWRARFDETQKPLSENVLRFASFVRRGGKWVTARQLASDGISRALLNFPGKGEVRVNP